MVSDNFGEFVSHVNSDNNYTEEFLLHKIEVESQPINFQGGITKYNRNFAMYELENVINSCSGSSPGQDELHYEMFRQLNLEQ